MFDKLQTGATNHQLGKLSKRSKRTIGKRKLAKFLVEKGKTKLTTDDASETPENDLEAE